jgi:hypothetical protein
MAYNRKELVKRIREEGAEAKRQGKTRESNPYKYMSEYQWFRGYDEEPGIVYHEPLPVQVDEFGSLKLSDEEILRVANKVIKILKEKHALRF